MNTAIATESLYSRNLRLSALEYKQHQVYLYSRPRCVGLVLGNACNIDCLHCYQSKNGDNLLRPPEIGRALRRELTGFYPYLSTLRIQGGEVFAIRGFEDIVEDVSRSVHRPVLSISTNGTLIDEPWAERLVRTPFSNLTISIDAGTRATFRRVRRGAELDQVLANIDRIRRWKEKLQTPFPFLDSFFVVMRSNFREIPRYLALMQEHGMISVSLQTMELSPQNLARVPTLGADESITEASEVRELHAILAGALPRFRRSFQMIRVSGLQSLFEQHGLDARFLSEGENSLYPDSEGLASGAFELCPNPWTTLFVVENGDVHLCFISEPVGNLYADPLPLLWNSPKAMAKRSDMIAGRYLASGCSRQYCGWREGKTADGPAAESDLQESTGLAANELITIEDDGQLPLIRTLVADERRRRAELEMHKRALESALAESRAQVEQLKAEAQETAALLAAGQRHIDHLEEKSGRAIADFRRLEAEWTRLRSRWIVRALSSLASLFRRVNMPRSEGE